MPTAQDLLPSAKALPKAERLKLIQLLLDDLTQQEEGLALRPDLEYPIWTPLESYSAARTLEQLLLEDRQRA